MAGRTCLPPMLAVLMGPPGAGKTSTTHRFGFTPDAVVSFDWLRLVCTGSPAPTDAANLTARIIAKIAAAQRMSHRLPTALDATNLGLDAYGPFLGFAEQHAVPVIAVALRTALPLCLSRQEGRRLVQPDTVVPAETVTAYHAATREAVTAGDGLVLLEEGFTAVLHVDGSHPGRRSALIGDLPEELAEVPWLAAATPITSLTDRHAPEWLTAAGR